MGLDMYLTRKVYVGAKYEHREVTGSVEVRIKDRPVDLDFNKIAYIEEEAAYWRKANAIHVWFVKNVQGGNDDCKEYYVTKENMEELLSVVTEVLQKSKLEKGVVQNGAKLGESGWIPIMEAGEYVVNPEVARELLPTQSGFFFGSTDYDQWYIDDLKYTKEVLEGILSREDDDGEYYYQSSW